MIETGFGENELGIDWDALWDNIPHDPGFNFVDQPSSGCSLSIDEIERYLLHDKCGYAEKEDQIVIDDGISPDLFLDLSPRSKDSSPSPDSAGTDPVDKQREIRVDDVMQNSDNNDAIDGADADDGDINDPDSRKRKRQLRNRDAAVRSRERKKMYVKDLEMKSKFYEAECKRLGMFLQSCVAENQALRFALHNTKAFDVSSMTKQESAVLLLESLLLGSLLGFLGILTILCLAIKFPTPTPTPERRSRDRRKVGGNDTWLFPPTTSMLGKKYRGSRSKMKRLFVYTHSPINMSTFTSCFRMTVLQ